MNNEVLILDPTDKDFVKKLKFAFNNNYHIPIVHKKQKKLKNPYLLLSKPSNTQSNNVSEFDRFVNNVSFALNNYKVSKKGLCQNYIILTDDTLKTLDYYTRTHKFKSKNGDTEQREISGVFNLCPIGDNMLEVSIDNKSIDTGELETANHTNTVGSFHTHPLDAYIKHNVCMAFPSADDYFTTLHIYASGYGVFHIVSTIEGLYVITIKKKFTKENKNKILKNFEKHKDYIEDKYGLDYPVCDIKKDNHKFWKKTIESYIRKMNRLKYFKIQFIFWKDAKKPIKITYGKINNNCLI